MWFGCKKEMQTEVVSKVFHHRSVILPFNFDAVFVHVILQHAVPLNICL